MIYNSLLDKSERISAKLTRIILNKAIKTELYLN